MLVSVAHLFLLMFEDDRADREWIACSTPVGGNLVGSIAPVDFCPTGLVIVAYYSPEEAGVAGSFAVENMQDQVPQNKPMMAVCRKNRATSSSVE